MTPCSCCWAWTPTHWEGWRYTDVTAMCSVKNRFKRKEIDVLLVTAPNDLHVSLAKMRTQRRLSYHHKLKNFYHE